MLSGCIGTAWPPLAAVGVNVCQRSLKRTSRGRPPYMYCWNLAVSPRFQIRRKYVEKGTDRWPSQLLQLEQTERRPRPWTVCHQIRSPQVQPDPWSQIVRPNPHLLWTTVAAASQISHEIRND